VKAIDFKEFLCNVCALIYRAQNKKTQPEKKATTIIFGHEGERERERKINTLQNVKFFSIALFLSCRFWLLPQRRVKKEGNKQVF
jgi:hypothetical protein